MFATAVLPQLIGELLGGAVALAFVLGLIGVWWTMWECIEDLPFYRYYFHYNHDKKLKDLELNRPIHAKKAYWPKWGIWYVYYASEDPHDPLIVKLGSGARVLQEGDVFEVVPGKLWGRRITILQAK